MPALFPAWADSVFRSALLGGVVLAAGVPALGMWIARSPAMTGEGEPIEQPVKFDHRHHVKDDGIDCLYCHVDAQRSRFAGVPATSVCMGCHDQVWTQSPELAPVRASAKSGAPIVWNRVNALPQHVFFDHRIHVAKGVGCETCHGRVDQMAAVRQEEPLTMKWCLECHRAPEKFLRPRENVTTMGFVPDRPQDEIGPALVAKYDVHPTTDCSGCHR
ncbi:MAG TPA: cytochrome c3 family protein [Polyangiaceae bacterium]